MFSTPILHAFRACHPTRSFERKMILNREAILSGDFAGIFVLLGRTQNERRWRINALQQANAPRVKHLCK